LSRSRPASNRLRSLALLALGLAACSGGCRRDAKTVIQSVDLDAEGFLKQSALGWFPGELNGRIADTLRTNGLPVLKEGEEAPSGARALKGKMSFDFELSEPRDASPGQVWVAALLQLQGGSLGELNSVSAHKQVALNGPGPEDRREATVRAVEAVLDDVAASAGALVKASGQTDDQLIKALESTEPRARNFAVKVLADRKNPAAVPALLEQLKNEDLDEVRSAIGALVELKDRRAVPAMIEASHARDNLFQRDVVFALGAIGGEDAEAYLFTMAQGHDEPAIRASAQQALDEMKARDGKKEGGRK
jgi:HEAT repeat protein